MNFNTAVPYTGNGTQTDYALPFTYTNQGEVKARLTGLSGADLPFIFISTNVIRFTAAPASGAIFYIIRETDLSAPVVVFGTGSILKEDLNATVKQLLQGLQELKDTPGTKGEKGDKGDQGIQGIQGPQGIQGVKGDQGIQGSAGTGVKILGQVATVGDLPASGNVVSDAYLVGTSLYVWTGSAWQNVGTIQGPKGDQGNQGIQGQKGDKGDTGTAPWLMVAPWIATTAYSATSPRSVVSYLGSAYVCSTSHTSGSTFDPANWTLLVSKGDKGDKGDPGTYPFTPVQQGTGVGQASNTVKIGWSGTDLKASVDPVGDLGKVWTDISVLTNYSATGYIKFPNGFIIQWGAVTANFNWTFPTAFPNTCLAAVISINSANTGASARWVRTNGWNKTYASTGGYYYNDSGNYGSSNISCFAIAFGY